ncbi:ABC transporter ATP-binding protein [Haliovirga abyssi]|uniref:Multidrug ABC transporter ATP-binding protein n=1 Tax=Haliovirga abyssi TaxID=2996794 RepID=A0AAU9DI05_9FUSO|nr:ABC transporter ATP-binding protein [Haliovirga abyssi]BDU51202.1 multidrug ABC transporter ATP-binding protein [Haliovirga abyssi]
MNYMEVIKAIKKMYTYLKKIYKLQIYVVFVMAVITILNLIKPLINKYIIDEFFIGKNIEALYIFILLYVTIFVMSSIFQISKDYLLAYIGNFISATLRKNMFKKIFSAHSLNIKEVNFGDIYVTFDSDIYNVEQVMSTKLFELIMFFFTFLVVSIIMIGLSWKYFLISFILIPGYVFNNLYFGKRLTRTNKKTQESVSNLFSFINESFFNFGHIKLNVKEKYIERKHWVKNRELIVSIFSYLKYKWLSNIGSSFIDVLEIILMFGFGGYLVYTGEISFGSYIALSSYGSILKNSLIQFINFNIDFHSFLVAVERIEKILNLKEENIKGKKIKGIEGDIKFENVSFSYEIGNKLFDNFNLKIGKGEKIAIVGESGSGKSSIVKLLMGLYEPEKGDIIIDGNNLKEININNYRKFIGVVNQDNFFFSDSLKENLLLGKKEKNEVIEEICNKCQMGEFLNQEKDGMMKKIDLNGSNISAGQRQRLSIARIILKNPDLVILDEATSALDNITERKIQDFLEKELKEKTVIMIAHRLSTVKNVDRIIVLKEGRVIEEGEHEELISKRGYYYDLVNRKDKN